MLAVHWFDKRDAFELSTIHDTGNVYVRYRASNDIWLKLIAINEYNKFMGGVDHCD